MAVQVKEGLGQEVFGVIRDQLEGLEGLEQEVEDLAMAVDLVPVVQDKVVQLCRIGSAGEF